MENKDVIYFIDTQSLFYGARTISELTRVDYKKLIPYLEEKYGKGMKIAYVVMSEYTQNEKFISLLKHLGCVVRRIYIDVKKAINNKKKRSWSFSMATDIAKYIQMDNIKKIVLVSGSGILIKTLTLAKGKEVIVVCFKELIHKAYYNTADKVEFIPPELTWVSIENTNEVASDTQA